MSLREISIGELVNKCKTWNPQKSEKTTFDYIDLSSVHKDLKAIVSTERIQCSDAPSRARQLVEKDDILISTVRPNLNGVAQVKDNHVGMTASTGYCILRPKPEKLDSNYLFQWVKTESFIKKMVDVAIGANYPAVSDSKVKESAIPLPPLPEQKRIAAILDAADALRTQRRQSIAELDLLLQSTFLEMFGDPVENPKGWEIQPLSFFGTWKAGGTPSRKTSNNFIGNIPWLSSRELNSTYISDSTEYISEEALKNSSAKIIKTGSLLLGMYDTAALKSSITTQKMSCNQAIAFSFLDEKRGKTAFIYWYIQIAKNHLKRNQRGVRQKNLNLSMIKDIPVITPPLSLQEKFTVIAENIEQQKTRLKTHLTELDTLFASLQQRAFNGEL